MVQKSITNFQLKERMWRSGITVAELARESGLYANDLSAILKGGIKLGPEREARLARGIVRLGLDRDAPPAPEAADPVVIRITRL